MTVARSLHVNHTGLVSGAEHSLLTLLGALDPARVAGVACPRGDLMDAVRELRLPAYAIGGTDASFRLSPRHTPVAVAELGRMALQIVAISHRTNADVVHANSVRTGLASALAGRIGAPPTLVHVRDVLPPTPAGRAVARAVLGQPGHVAAISAHVADALTTGRPRAGVSVVDNAVDLRRFDRDRVDRDVARAALGLDGATDDSVDLAIVGQITAWKGHDTAIRALALARARHDGLRLIIAGSVKFAADGSRFSNVAYLERLHRLVDELELGDAVRFIGERDDVPSVLRACDALLMPSVDEPFGRSLVEAMAMGTPVVATSVGGPATIIEGGRTGLLVAPGDPDAWAQAIVSLAEDPGGARRRAAAARDVARARYSQTRHAARVGELLDLVAGRDAT